MTIIAPIGIVRDVLVYRLGEGDRGCRVVCQYNFIAQALTSSVEAG